VKPRPIVRDLIAYAVPRSNRPIDLWLDSNEGAQPSSKALRALREIDPQRIRRYPGKKRAEELIALKLGINPAHVILTAGGDDAIDRCCRAMLEPGREIILPSPTFEMIERSARIAGGEIVEIPWWRSEFPRAEVLARISPRTAMVALVTPNNPTGAVIPLGDLRAIAEAAPHALLLVDLAYVEFADDDITSDALQLPNAVIIRTFSKALGCAGLRAGYALGRAEVIGWLRAMGGPYPTSGPSLAIIEALLESGVRDEEYFEQVRRERSLLTKLARGLGASAHPSQANFVLVDVADSIAFRDGMAERRIAVRVFPGHQVLGRSVRITCPGCANSFAQLERAIRDVLRESVT
jgi:histidinol-phosphate aminotransferase